MKPLFAAIGFFSLWHQAAGAQTFDEDLAQAFGDKAFVSIATGTRQSVSQAPAAATVITAADIRAMGAANLDQVLETVPGLHVSYSAIFNTPIYSIRGIHTQFNPQVLMLINGNPITALFQGNRGLAIAGLPIQNISRVEVIRGSGSALYGADAFAGVINVITKTAGEISGVEFEAGVASHQTREAAVLHGGKWQGWDVVAWLRQGQTAGAGRRIEADAASGLDQIFASHTSRSPGPTNDNYREQDGALELSQRNWRWRVNYSRFYDVGSGAGVAQALDPDGRSEYQRFNTDLSYHTTDWVRNWDITLQMSYFQNREQSYLYIFPTGALNNTFPNGIVGAPDKSERHLGFSASAFYTGWDQHRLRLGTGVENYGIYNIRERKNFDFLFVPGTGYILAPLSSVIEAGRDKIFLDPHTRHLNYVFAQDEWYFAPDWTLTGGVRYDRFSDFGSTTNPRFALVWKASYNLSAKLLYGRAFRAPSFAEQYIKNNPSTTGNPNVQPEKIATQEAGLNWQPRPGLQLGVNLFRYRIRDQIRYVTNPDSSTGATAQNLGEQRGHGLELEAQWRVGNSLQLSGNYAWQRSIDETSGKDAGLAPTQHAFLRGAWQIRSGLALDTRLNWVAGRKREPGDARPAVADYHTVDLTLRHGNDNDRWQASLSLLNIFNADAREPSLSPGSIPFDLPQPRRGFYCQISYKL
jgi:iron complex outermembrane receptor protein